LTHLQSLLPKGCSISNGHSTTLIEIGYEAFVKQSQDYKNFKGEAVSKMMAGDMAGYGAAISAGYAADYFVTSMSLPCLFTLP
jgi:hypothetical protein